MKLSTPALLSIMLVVGCAGISQSPDNDQRFIPVELWAGAKWDGVEEVTFSAVDVASGKGNKRRISGPRSWRHPYTGEHVLVYERLNHKKDGLKRQLFALNDERTSLGRVYDSRAGSKDRWFRNEAMFPVGYWKRGEERTFPYLQYLETGPVRRVATIKIRRLDYIYKGIPHSLKYDWTLRDEHDRVLFRERYVYSPGKSLVRFTDRMRK